MLAINPLPYPCSCPCPCATQYQYQYRRRAATTNTGSPSITLPSSASFTLKHNYYCTASNNTINSFNKFKVSCGSNNNNNNNNNNIDKPLKVMITGAPASGKGTQSHLIVQHFGLLHISTGDLLRAEVAAQTDIGIKAQPYINSGSLVPDHLVTAMVRSRLSLPDAKERGWLLDGYPRTSAQAHSLLQLGITPDVFLVLEVPDDILINRCVGRRLDPLTGNIYHITSFPPESEEIKARLVTRTDDTPEKVTSRLEIYKKNVEAVIASYVDVMRKIDGNRSKEVIFEEIRSLLSRVQDEKVKASTTGTALTQGSGSNLASPIQDKWRGIPTRLNNIPHSREIREYFYDDVLQATLRAVNDGKTRIKVEISIPELNPATDVYRIGTLMELVRVIALTFADDGKRVKVCVQGSMGEGALAGMPLQLAGTRKILEFMDWGDYGAKGTFINIGSIGITVLAPSILGL